MDTARHSVDPNPERFRDYLRLLAETGFPRRFQARFTPSDVVQETMMRAWGKRGQMRARSDAEMACWLAKLLRTVLLNLVRHHEADKRSPDREEGPLVRECLEDSDRKLRSLVLVVDSTPSKATQREETKFIVLWALSQLLEDQRRAIQLHVWQDLKIDDIARLLGKTGPSVAGLLQRGLRAMRQKLLSVSSS